MSSKIEAMIDELCKPTAVPEASTKTLPDGWTMTYPGSAELKLRNISVDADADGITTEERVSGYSGYTSTVWVPLSVLRALLASLDPPLTIIGAKERAVLEACAKLSTDSLRAFGPPWSTPWSKFAEAELARSGGK